MLNGHVNRLTSRQNVECRRLTTLFTVRFGSQNISKHPRAPGITLTRTQVYVDALKFYLKTWNNTFQGINSHASLARRLLLTSFRLKTSCGSYHKLPLISPPVIGPSSYKPKTTSDYKSSRI